MYFKQHNQIWKMQHPFMELLRISVFFWAGNTLKTEHNFKHISKYDKNYLITYLVKSLIIYFKQEK